jgi:hypothetical protein
VTLRSGETILTDGVSDIRARCGNRLSRTPRKPILPPGAPEPNEADMDETEPRTPVGRLSLSPGARSSNVARNVAEHLQVEPQNGIGRMPHPAGPNLAASGASHMGTGHAGVPWTVFPTPGPAIPPEWLAAHADDFAAMPLAPEGLRPGPPPLVPPTIVTPEAVFAVPGTYVIAETRPQPPLPRDDLSTLPPVRGGVSGTRQPSGQPDPPAPFISMVERPTAPSGTPVAGTLPRPTGSTENLPPTSIPEPSTSILIAGGFAALAVLRCAFYRR